MPFFVRSDARNNGVHPLQRKLVLRRKNTVINQAPALLFTPLQPVVIRSGKTMAWKLLRAFSSHSRHWEVPHGSQKHARKEQTGHALPVPPMPLFRNLDLRSGRAPAVAQAKGRTGKRARASDEHRGSCGEQLNVKGNFFPPISAFSIFL